MRACDTHDHGGEGGRRRGGGGRGGLAVARRGRALVLVPVPLALALLLLLPLLVARRCQRVPLGDGERGGAAGHVPALHKQRALLQFG